MHNLRFEQHYDRYTEDDHRVWAYLNEWQDKLLNSGKVAEEYLDGFRMLQLDRHRIADIATLSESLQQISGWSLIPVSGLIPTRDFFFMLIHKKYPVTVYMRKWHEIKFSEQPDIFHDVYGHLPLLTNEKFTRFLTAYSIIALKYVNNDRAIDFLGRLYWFTYEMGLIRKGDGFKAYGGAIITSAEEINNTGLSSIAKYDFDLEHIFRTPYNSFKLQREYFIIESFDDLFQSIELLEKKLIEHLLLPVEDYTLRNYSLNPNLGRNFNNVIGFLNDIQYRFPGAISFVAGQPDERFFNVEEYLSKFDTYVNYIAEKQQESRIKVVNNIGQYNKTKGIVNDVIAEYLAEDENIRVTPDQVLMTVGAQEAFAITVSTLCNREQDVILLEDPSYIGLSSFSRVFGYQLSAVSTDEEGINLQELKNKIVAINRSGKKVKLLYVIPDYQNPTGSCMPIGNRLKLLELAQQYNFLILEDNVYNSFTYKQQRNPTLKSLDRSKRVIYVGSFSKSLFPGLRVGLIAADQEVENEEGNVVRLIDEMVKVKAQLTNNTSTINQAIVAGVLLEQQFSLNSMNAAKLESYRNKSISMANALDQYIRAYEGEWAQDIHWQIPDGGFFIKMSLPFEMSVNDVADCAEQYGVIVCPMRYFYLEKGGEREIRLTFSNISDEAIIEGIKRLAGYFESRVSTATSEYAGAAATTSIFK